MDPRDPELQLSPVERAPASRKGIVVAAAVLSLVAAGAVLAVVTSRSAVAPTQRATPAGSAVGSAAASAALDPLVQAMTTPPPDPAKMKLDAAITTSGGHVSVTFDRPVYSPTNARSWIAIAKVGAPDSSYEAWTYLEDGSQTAQLVAPTQPGDYEMRMHDDYPQQTYHVIARLPFKVESGLAEDPDPPQQSSRSGEHFTLSATTFEAGAEIVAKFPWPLVAKKGEKYWITISRVGDSDSSYGGWQYLPASATKTSMQAPSSSGKYEMRLHGNYPTKSTNVVYRVPFEVE